jgi:tRNA pseudouridine55 synthase
MSRPRKPKGRPVSGWIVLDKPAGIGSTECVSRIKRLYQAAKAGHAGTLDPLASGMLPIALGEATKTVPWVMDGSKVYRFEISWGAETATDDLEGEVTNRSDARPSREAILAAMPRYLGDISQVPPRFSAIKIAGERAYALARQGEEVEIEARQVTIHRFDLLELPAPDRAIFEVECGKGTYVRSLARDMGRDLGCLGHVSMLRRVAVHPFLEEDLVPLAELEALAGDLEALDAELLPTGVALDELEEVQVNREQALRIRAGNPVLLRGRDAPSFAEEACAVFGAELVAIGSVEQGSFLPSRVFRVSAA